MRLLLTLLLLLSFLLACMGPMWRDSYRWDSGRDWGRQDVDFDGYTEAEGDCDDHDNDVHPDATELCNGEDDDCDGLIDDEDPDAEDAVVWNIDHDGDGYGSADYIKFACEQPSGWTDDDSDCDDLDAAVNPDADEVCNDADDDCDGLTDDEDDDVDVSDAATWYQDADGDGYGADDKSVQACQQPKGWVETGGDCDDQDAEANPDTGCRNGSWSGEIVLTLSAGTDKKKGKKSSATCTGSLLLEVDQGAAPQVQGEGSCELDQALDELPKLIDLSFTAQGSFSTADNLEGELALDDGKADLVWAAGFEKDALTGEASGTIAGTSEILVEGGFTLAME